MWYQKQFKLNEIPGTLLSNTSRNSTTHGFQNTQDPLTIDTIPWLILLLGNNHQLFLLPRENSVIAVVYLAETYKVVVATKTALTTLQPVKYTWRFL